MRRGFEIVTFADRPDLEEELHALARLAYADQPGRSESRIDNWPDWGLHAHRPDAYFIALEDGRVLGYGYLEREGETWSNGFMAVARAARGRGVAGALKRAQIKLGEGAGNRHAADRERGAARFDARSEPPVRLRAAVRGDRAARAGCLGEDLRRQALDRALQERDRELRLFLERLLQRRAVEREAADVGDRLYAGGPRSVLGE